MNVSAYSVLACAAGGSVRIIEYLHVICIPSLPRSPHGTNPTHYPTTHFPTTPPPHYTTTLLSPSATFWQRAAHTQLICTYRHTAESSTVTFISHTKRGYNVAFSGRTFKVAFSLGCFLIMEGVTIFLWHVSDDWQFKDTEGPW